MGHFGYRNLQKLTSLSTEMSINGPVLDEICGPCMKKRQQRHSLQILTTKMARFLNEVHNDLGNFLPKIWNGMAYYELFQDNSTEAYFAYPMRMRY